MTRQATLRSAPSQATPAKAGDGAPEAGAARRRFKASDLGEGVRQQILISVRRHRSLEFDAIEQDLCATPEEFAAVEDFIGWAKAGGHAFGHATIDAVAARWAAQLDEDTVPGDPQARMPGPAAQGPVDATSAEDATLGMDATIVAASADEIDALEAGRRRLHLMDVASYGLAPFAAGAKLALHAPGRAASVVAVVGAPLLVDFATLDDEDAGFAGVEENPGPSADPGADAWTLGTARDPWRDATPERALKRAYRRDHGEPAGGIVVAFRIKQI